MSFAKRAYENQFEYGEEEIVEPDTSVSLDDPPLPIRRTPRLTNNLNLPAPLVSAVTRHPRPDKPNSISVSELIQPPQLRALVRKHADELTEDASDRLWALLGTLLHGVMEQHAQGMKDHTVEEELTTEILGWKVIGHYDLSEMVLDGELLTDWKLTSVYSMKDKDLKPEWDAQINCYAELLRRAGRKVTRAQIVAIGRDWSQSRAHREQDYPQQQVKIKAVELWPSERVTQFMEERVRLHQEAEKGCWPDCTPEERWARPDIWALKKKNQKKAVKLFEDKELAEKWLSQILGGEKSHYIEFRQGESIRCAAYCPAAPKCSQWAKLNPTLSDTLKESIKVAQQRKENAA
jgi:hypothetical protein